MMKNIWQWQEPDAQRKPWLIGAGIALAVLLVIVLILAFWWSREPKPFWVTSDVSGQRAPIGYSTTQTLIEVAEILLDKPGGYLSNDIAPPGIFLDNVPSWEFGVVVQVRDLARAMRNDYSRSQSQSTEDPDLALAEPVLNYDHNSWMLPSSERQYRKGIRYLKAYRDRLSDPDNHSAQFYARADNFREWLAVVEKRLGSLSQRLSASVGQVRVNTDLAGERAAANTDILPDYVSVQTPWLKIDNVFFEARGNTWALVHFLRAAQFDFEKVLKDKNAIVSLRQIIRELEGGLRPIKSLVILNGSGYGVFANHSLVLASYLSRANSAVINLRELLDQG
ncbi:MAG: DUF2333 family protein [Gammaproteobacteria bacterium]|nr:DUF2333 family protein [Gammaproteobacteria bacterium]MCZ6686785.1 DUF2333 family protein [Gammaproteobacteria bacterium]MCZ6763065.1 DUF2333 family protein [Gammaproteobacteria bacterium]MCZ6879879.1 DUF2333 family protein [Gammaproteobacteria bacterium]